MATYQSVLDAFKAAGGKTYEEGLRDFWENGTTVKTWLRTKTNHGVFNLHIDLLAFLCCSYKVKAGVVIYFNF
jgi:hypothetical protein